MAEQNFDLNNVQEPIPKQADADSAGDDLFEALPCGDYYVRCIKVEGKTIHPDDHTQPSYPVADCEFRIIYPAEYSGKTLRLRIPVYHDRESDFNRKKRHGILVTSGMVKKGDAMGLAKFKLPALLNQDFVFRCGQVKYHSEKHNREVTMNEPFDFFGLHPSKSWENKEWIRPAPQDWQPRVRKGKGDEIGGDDKKAAPGKPKPPAPAQTAPVANDDIPDDV